MNSFTKFWKKYKPTPIQKSKKSFKSQPSNAHAIQNRLFPARLSWWKSLNPTNKLLINLRKLWELKRGEIVNRVVMNKKKSFMWVIAKNRQVTSKRLRWKQRKQLLTNKKIVFTNIPTKSAINLCKRFVRTEKWQENMLTMQGPKQPWRRS